MILWLSLAIQTTPVTVELWMLAASVALGMIQLIASSHLISWQRGYRWTAGSREEAFQHFAVWQIE